MTAAAATRPLSPPAPPSLAKRIVLLTLVAATLASGVGMLVVRVRFGHLSARAQLSRAIKPSARIDLAALAPFPWDHVYVFGPYTTREDLAAGKHLPSALAMGLNLESRDDVCLLLFTESGAYSSHIVFPRAAGDFAPAVRKDPYPRAAAKFDVRGSATGLQVSPAASP